MSSTLQIQTPRAFLPLLRPARYKGAHGGRGSGKSHFFAELLIEECIADPTTRAVCVREIQKSLDQSVKQLLEDKIRTLGVQAHFEVLDTEIHVLDDDGQRCGLIIFQGMQNHTADSIKSLEGYRIAWVEEAQSLSQRSLDLLTPTLRVTGAEIWFSWNPRRATDPVDAFMRSEDAANDNDIVCIAVNYTDNPWFAQTSLAADMERDRRRDPDKYAHVWLGGYETNSEARVFRNWRVEAFDTPADAVLRFGADWGFAIDPTTLLRMFVVGRTLYIDHEAYKIGCEIDETPALFAGDCPAGHPEAQRWQNTHGHKGVPGSLKWTITADSARPETVSYMKRKGYPEHEAKLRLACSQGDFVDATWDDRPEAASTMWTDPKRKRMLRVEMYKRERGEWLKCAFVGSLKLEEGPSPYVDNDGKPCNPIEAHSAYVDDENQRYGVVADMVGPQDEINVYRRRAAHHATFRQVQETDPVSAYADPEEVRREAAKPDGVIPPGYGIVPNDKFQLDIALLQEAKGEIERIGPSPEVLGRQSASASGRAHLIRQQAGMTELAHLFAGLDDLELRVYRQAWARIRQFWKAPKFIRVTDDENAVKFVQINEPVTGPPQPVIDPTTGLPKFDPITRQIVMETPVVGVRNEVAKMGVDIIVDSTPDTANVQQEQYIALVDLAKVGALGPNPGPLLLRASSLPKKRELLDELEKMQQPQGPPPLTPEQQEALRLEMAEKAANIDKTGAQAQQARATAMATVAKAQTDRMQALQPPEPPAPGAF